MLDVVPMQTGSTAQKIPGTPSTLTGLLPLGQDPTTVVVVVVVVVGAGEDGADVGVLVGEVVGVFVGVAVGATVVATVVDTGAEVVETGGWVVIEVAAGADPVLQPKTPEATVPQYDPSGSPLWATGQ